METFGVVFVEALACGKPVIATKIGGPSEIVTPEVGLLVPPGDAKALAEAIDFMLHHLREYNPEKIVEYGCVRYSYEAVAKALDQVYRSLVP